MIDKNGLFERVGQYKVVKSCLPLAAAHYLRTEYVANGFFHYLNMNAVRAFSPSSMKQSITKGHIFRYKTITEIRICIHNIETEIVDAKLQS